MGVNRIMRFKSRTIGKKKYRYAVKSVRLSPQKVVRLEKLYKNESAQELGQIFLVKEQQEHFKYALNTFGPDHIFTESVLQHIETNKFGYRRLLRGLTPVSLQDLLNRFTANFTYESNALEGNSLTLKDVSLVMFENISVPHKDLREIYETRNSRQVVELIHHNKFALTHQDIIKMHQLLVKDLEVHTGYKQFPNIILGKTVPTTPPEKVHEKMEELLQWYHQNKDKLHPLRLAAIFHGRFEQIHPFEDGNGRVGRFLINLILTKSKYPPLIIRKTQRVSYLKALENFDHHHKDTLERFLIERFNETYHKFFEIYVKYLQN